ncbi:MAG: hypothetical protein OJF49_001756 [Ktedonobacterales bacterium]|nr:MAG: hypothetical protein OJF49_001756 [Ktedonobacterales bacterium]
MALVLQYEDEGFLFALYSLLVGQTFLSASAPNPRRRGQPAAQLATCRSGAGCERSGAAARHAGAVSTARYLNQRKRITQWETMQTPTPTPTI